MENLLTIDEIRKILESAKLNPALQLPNTISFGRERTSIITITPKNGIIVIKGDSDTGFSHINERHSYWSKKTYWSPTSDKIKPPSQFGKESTPIVDYVEILDALCVEENLNTSKNKNPDLFDMFTGEVETTNLEFAKYHALLYKNTPIAHTLYPQSQKKNKKTIIDFVRGRPKGRLTTNPPETIIAVPYSNKEGNVAFSFQVRYDFKTKKESGCNINHMTNQVADLYERSLPENVELNHLMQELDFADLTSIEKVIKQLIKN